MDIQYRRDMNHTYMVLESTDAAVLESYETRILLTNRIPGLLPCSLQYLDNRTCFCYDTTSRQSLATGLEGREITFREMRDILGSILSVMKGMEEYLLSLRHLVLTPEQIYLVPDTLEAGLCFAPFYERETREGLLAVTEFLLSHTGKGSQDAVILGSRFSHALRQPNTQMPDLERILYGELPGCEDYMGNAAIFRESAGLSGGPGFYANSAGNPYAQDGLGSATGMPGSGAAGTPEGTSFKSNLGGRAGRERQGEFGWKNGLPGQGELGWKNGQPGQGELGWKNGLPGQGDSGRKAGKSFRDDYEEKAGNALKRDFEGKSGETSQRAFGGEKAHRASQGVKICWYVAAVVLAGAVLVAGVYVFLHYYNGVLPTWPFLAGACVVVVGAVLLVFIVRRKVLKKSWPRENGAEEPYVPFGEGKAPSPYQGAYGGAAGVHGSHSVFGSTDAVVGYSMSGFGTFANAGMTGASSVSPSQDIKGSPLMEPGLTTILAPPKEDLTKAGLVSDNGPDQGKEFGLSAKRTRIGKLAGHADICTDSPAVSRLHAEIICKGEAFYIRDLNSRNGTSVNDELLAGNTEKLLRDGDRLKLADRVFIFRQPVAERPEGGGGPAADSGNTEERQNTHVGPDN